MVKHCFITINVLLSKISIHINISECIFFGSVFHDGGSNQSDSGRRSVPSFVVKMFIAGPK